MKIPKHIDVFSCPKRLVYLGGKVSEIADPITQEPDKNIQQKETKEVILTALEKLTIQEKIVLLTRLGLNNDEPKTYKDIGLVLKVCIERVRQIEYNALRKLKNPKFLRLFAKNINLLPFLNGNHKTMSYEECFVRTLIK